MSHSKIDTHVACISLAWRMGIRLHGSQPAGRQRGVGLAAVVEGYGILRVSLVLRRDVKEDAIVAATRTHTSLRCRGERGGDTTTGSPAHASYPQCPTTQHLLLFDSIVLRFCSAVAVRIAGFAALVFHSWYQAIAHSDEPLSFRPRQSRQSAPVTSQSQTESRVYLLGLDDFRWMNDLLPGCLSTATWQAARTVPSCGCA
ncbi:hypothetical protein F5X99DRAFT_374283 [Biscogniauxia marginata]|nr:hypothetical protein F5X99DRAFT_374283 [Biscogniauxia marginata]